MNEDVPPDAVQHQNPPHAGQTENERDLSANDRDLSAEAHDRESETRDKRAEARDRRAEARNGRAGEINAAAASDRAAALQDRQGAAGDRGRAAIDREASAGDRITSAKERRLSSIDELTGAYRRGPGIVEVERAMAMAKRTNRLLVLAFIDVDGLKATNDSLGHAAGDRLLRGAIGSIFTRLRPYDLIVRMGGDEFVCLLLDLNLSAAARRFGAIKEDLIENQGGSITVGLAEMQSEDSLESLMTRADEDLYRERGEEPAR